MSDNNEDDAPAADLGLSDEGSYLDELRKDLQLYDNPEVFGDFNLPQIYQLSITDLGLPERLTVFSAQIDGDVLPLAIRETFLRMVKLIPSGEQLLVDNFGTSDIAELRSLVEEEEDYHDLDMVMRQFFVRHFPRLQVHLYNIAIVMTALSSLMRAWEDIPANDRHAGEKMVRETMKTMVSSLHRDIKKMLKTRTRGGSNARLAMEHRQSLHVRYGSLHNSAKEVKRHYDSMFDTFSASHRRSGFEYENWQQFWVDYSGKIFPDLDVEFLSLFASEDTPSASDVAYMRLSSETGHSLSYTKRLVIESRKRSDNEKSHTNVTNDTQSE